MATLMAELTDGEAAPYLQSDKPFLAIERKNNAYN